MYPRENYFSRMLRTLLISTIKLLIFWLSPLSISFYYAAISVQNLCLVFYQYDFTYLWVFPKVKILNTRLMLLVSNPALKVHEHMYSCVSAKSSRVEALCVNEVTVLISHNMALKIMLSFIFLVCFHLFFRVQAVVLIVLSLAKFEIS